MLILSILLIALAQDLPTDPLLGVDDDLPALVEPPIEEADIATEGGVDFSPSLVDAPPHQGEPLYETIVRVAAESIFFALPTHWQLNGVFMLILGFLVESRLLLGKAWSLRKDAIGRGIRPYLPEILARLLGLRTQGERLTALGATLEKRPLSRADLANVEARLRGLIKGQTAFIKHLHERLADLVDLDEREAMWLAEMEQATRVEEARRLAAMEKATKVEEAT